MSGIVEFVQSEIATEDFRTANVSFKRRLLNRKILFLDDLKNMAINDSLLYRKKRTIVHSIGLMKKFIGNDDDVLQTLSLNDFIDFGLNEEEMLRLGYLAYQYDTIYPMVEPIEGDEQIDLYYDEDDVTNNPKLMEVAFHHDLVAGKLTYLDSLRLLMLEDYELEDQEPSITNAFRLMTAFIGSDDNTSVIERINLTHWLEFGLDQSTINRLGYLAYQRRCNDIDDSESTKFSAQER